ncbi:hypothetical protein, partial [Muribaculum intestinale]|uniref:hypothetical protein n=1 Tax=Muribaculum intestinale TaxID=1796646 RepID=UPI0025A97DDA
FDLRKISASKNNSENKPSVGSVSGLAKTERPQILPNHCYWEFKKSRMGNPRRIPHSFLTNYTSSNPGAGC